jgi:hypothetical protein
MAGIEQLAALNVIDHAVLTCSSTAACTLGDGTPALVNGKVGGKTVRRVLITSETGTTRWRADGTAPTDATGHALAKDSSISFTGANYKQLINTIQFIGAGSTTTLQITYFD